MLEHADEVRVDSHRFEKVHLRLSLREAIKDPTVDTAVTLADSGVNKAQNDLIRDSFALFSGFLQLDLDGRISLSLSLKDLLWAHVDESESISDELSLG